MIRSILGVIVVLQSLESRLATGALIVADDIVHPSMSDYLEYLRNARSLD